MQDFVRRACLIILGGMLTACATTQSNSATLPPAQTTLAQITPQPEMLPAATNISVPEGFAVEVYAQGLANPTALAWGDDGTLYVTQISGQENGGSGQVVAIATGGAAPVVVLEGVFKPTGLVWREDELYLAAGRDLLRTRFVNGSLAPPERVVGDLAFNGRSEGQIDLLPDGRLVFEASGSVGDPNSGRLWTLQPDNEPQVLATGLKNGYAYALDPASGQMYSTEIGDDAMNGTAPPEEINVIQAAGDYGWPLCYAEREPALDRGATSETCTATQPPVVTFPRHSTPTGLAWYDQSDFPAPYRDSLYVALWNGDPPQVLHVALRQENGRTVGTATPFISGMKRPIDVLADPNGGLLALDYVGGIVYRVYATASR